MSPVEKILHEGLLSLGIDATQKQIELNMLLQQQLLLWNKKINLTAIKRPEEVISKHILDSLSLYSLINQVKGTTLSESLTVLDVGAGAGFPTLPLAIFTPKVVYHPIDSNNKKVSFIQRMTTLLGLKNVIPIHSRIQDLKPTKPYSIVTARAFADINDLLQWLPLNCLDNSTQVLAMKGKIPEQELKQLELNLTETNWVLQDIVNLNVPGLNAERCVLRINYHA